MTLFPKLSLAGVNTISIEDRPRKVGEENLAAPFYPSDKGEFSDLVKSLPDILKAHDLKQFCTDLAQIHSSKKKIALLFGGHVIKTGLAPVIIDLMERGI